MQSLVPNTAKVVKDGEVQLVTMNPEDTDITDAGQEEEHKPEVRKYTDWANEPTLADLKHDLSESMPFHEDQVAIVQDYIDALEVRGSYKVPKEKNKSSVTPKLIRKHAEWRYPAQTEPYLSNDKLFNAAPTTSQDRDKAKKAGMLLNAQMKARGKVEFIDKYARVLSDTGTAIIHYGWNIKTEMQMQTQEIPAVDDKGFAYLKAVEVEVEVVIEENPTAEVLMIDELILDPTCKGDIDKAKFAIHKFESSLSELKEEKKYFNLDNLPDSVFENTEASAESTIVDNTADTFKFKDKARKVLKGYRYWGFWDVDGNGTTEGIVATWLGDTLIGLEKNSYPKGNLPFILVPYMLDLYNTGVYGRPDAELLTDNQQISGALTRGMLDQLGKAATGQVGRRKGALDKTNSEKFEKGQPYEWEEEYAFDDVFKMHKYPDISSSAFNMLTLQSNEAEALTGIKAFSSGLNGNQYGEVATGIRSALDATSKRESSILRRMSRGLILLGQRWLELNTAFLSKEQFINITEDDYDIVDPQELQGDFNVNISISTPEKDEDSANKTAMLLQTLGNSIDQGLTKILLEDISLLRNKPELARKIREFEPQPDPIQQEIQMLQVQKLKAEIEWMQRREQVDELDRAKIEKLLAEADRLNLDFVEQDTGTLHERELERVREQKKDKAKGISGKQINGGKVNGE